MPLQTLEPKRLYRQIADQLRELIGNDEFAVGARLPAERDLARQLGVSRPSVREALIALEVEGWVEIRTGSGIYVLDRKTRRGTALPKVPATEWGPLELLRARRLIEGEIAALAATLAKRRHLQAMRDAIDAMALDAQRGVVPIPGDHAFHAALAECCGNGVLTETIHRFWDARHGALFERLGDHFETRSAWLEAIAEHEAVLAAVAARDASAARAAMHRHLDRSHSRYSASWRRAAHPSTRQPIHPKPH